MGENQSPAVPLTPPTLQVGINYNWPYDMFGDHMVHARGDSWVKSDLPADLIEYQKHGIAVVRFWLLCDLNGAHAWGTLLPNGDIIAPPAANPKYRDALEGILNAFDGANSNGGPKILVMPCLLSFGAFAKTERFQVAKNPGIRKEFLEQVLRPLADLSTKHHSSMHSWDIINEIGWNWMHPDPKYMTLTRSETSDFLNEALATVNDAASAAGVPLATTVGHGEPYDLAFPSGSVWQFHFYPFSHPIKTVPNPLGGTITLFAAQTLPPYPAVLFYPVVGEISTRAAVPTNRYTDPEYRQWRELNGADIGSQYQAVLRRLWRLNDLGYKLVLLWPDIDKKLEPTTRAPQKFSPDVWRAVDDFRSGVRP